MAYKIFPVPSYPSLQKDWSSGAVICPEVRGMGKNGERAPVEMGIKQAERQA